MLKFPIQASFLKRRLKNALLCVYLYMCYIIHFLITTKRKEENGPFPKRGSKSKVQPMGK